MLRELHIHNLAVIEDAAIEFADGLNVFTGQTGAGKSLVIGAFEILLGLRPGGDMIRPGADDARVSGVFELSDPETAAEIARITDQELDPADGLLITRKISAAGRSSVSVNGQPATAAMVKQVGQLLVDIHGQHDHQYLLKPSNQLLILDAFARCGDERKRFAEAWAKLRELEGKRRELQASSTLRKQQLELYEFQAEEIDAADPQPGEFPELQARHNVLSNVQRIKKEAGGAHAALYESEGSVAERLQMITHVLLELADIDESLKETAENIREATLSLQEYAYELGRYVDRLDLDPGELAEVEERLNTLNRLIAKYGERAASKALPGAEAGEDPVATVTAYREGIEREIQALRGQETDLSQIDGEIAAVKREAETMAKALTEARKGAAKKLRPLIEAQLKHLGMPEASFDVKFETVPLAHESAGPSGLDAIEMVVQTNPGQEMRPLRKIASGGELSRIMLAIKSILAGSDRVSVLVFDEIDANIGGRLGSVIGQKLRELAAGVSPEAVEVKSNGKKKGSAKPQANSATPKHQVLCITHLPQIAAFAHRHLRIHKAVTGEGKTRETRTTVAALEGKARIDELAEMMAGHDVTETTRKQAKELLAAAGV